MSYNPLAPSAEDMGIPAHMTIDEWIAAVQNGCIAGSEHLPTEATMNGIETGRFDADTMLGVAWKSDAKRFGRRFAIPQDERLRTPLTAEFAAFLVVAQWRRTFAELQASEQAEMPSA